MICFAVRFDKIPKHNKYFIISLKRITCSLKRHNYLFFTLSQINLYRKSSFQIHVQPFIDNFTKEDLYQST